MDYKKTPFGVFLCYNKIMDVVYILGTGSLVNNEEIRLSIRSLESNMKDLRDIYIVGELPDFLQNIKHIPANDGSIYKYINAYHKVLNACKNENISDEFLLMNDDFFMTREFLGAEFPFYALENSNGGACGANSFHIHCPIRIQKEWFQKMPIDLSFKSCKSPRTFYANFYKAPPKFCNDFVVRAGDGCRNFDEQIKNKPLFSISDTAMLYPSFIKWLNKLYPVPSSFEKL